MRRRLRRRYGRTMTPSERLADLHRQGFMKPRKARKAAKERPIVACDACLNWHREGKHTATPDQRRVNLAARKRQPTSNE